MTDITVSFLADPNATTGNVQSCFRGYVNVPVTNISDNDLITKISNGDDFTQFNMSPSSTYTIHISDTTQLDAYSPTFTQLRTLLTGSDTIFPEANYSSGPHVECPDEVSWLFYSVAEKQPVEVALTPNLPPYADQTQTAIVHLNTEIIHGDIGDNSYVKLSLPTAPEGYTLVVQPTANNTVLATRVNACIWSWVYTYYTLPITVYFKGILVWDMKLAITAN